MLAVVAPEWQISDVILPTATPAEIELRLRLAAAGTPTGAAAVGSAPAAVSAAGVVIDEGNFTARVHDRLLDLTYKEFELLHFLTRNPDRVFTREHLLIKVKVDNTTRSQILEAVNLFRARVVDVATDALVIETTGDSGKIQAFLRVLEPYGIREIAQSGLLAIGRGGKSITERVHNS